MIGTVVSLAQNTWSDGYSAGLEVVDVVCTGTSAFWETSDPTEEIQWACKSAGPYYFKNMFDQEEFNSLRWLSK